ncbi:hypothetical protein K440DRAFT_641964 [Wilcoxina mikolae CBS 423.85]|nr:hypothetical protein K440DRAFT_641964 [Wilcoxina mikolae CBS 423.85]
MLVVVGLWKTLACSTAKRVLYFVFRDPCAAVVQIAMFYDGCLLSDLRTMASETATDDVDRRATRDVPFVLLETGQGLMMEWVSEMVGCLQRCWVCVSAKKPAIAGRQRIGWPFTSSKVKTTSRITVSGLHCAALAPPLTLAWKHPGLHMYEYSFLQEAPVRCNSSPSKVFCFFRFTRLKVLDFAGW